jgi:hypothetical protein
MLQLFAKLEISMEKETALRREKEELEVGFNKVDDELSNYQIKEILRRRELRKAEYAADSLEATLKIREDRIDRLGRLPRELEVDYSDAFMLYSELMKTNEKL